MQVVIQRKQKERQFDEMFLVFQDQTILEALREIKERHDPTLCFREGCRSGICGSCAVNRNGRPVLSCVTQLEDKDKIGPLNYLQAIRDLVVDMDKTESLLVKTRAWLEETQPAEVAPEEEKRYRVQSDCILCQSCYSVCPVLEVMPEFEGPYALSRVFRYVIDTRESAPKPKIDSIQTQGVWDCTLCNECTVVCPQGLDPKNDILNLRGRSQMAGYSDPNLTSFDGGMGGFGFQP